MLVSFALPIPYGFNFVIDSLGVHTWPILLLLLSKLLVDSRKMGSTAQISLPRGFSYSGFTDSLGKGFLNKGLTVSAARWAHSEGKYWSAGECSRPLPTEKQINTVCPGPSHRAGWENPPINKDILKRWALQLPPPTDFLGCSKTGWGGMDGEGHGAFPQKAFRWDQTERPSFQKGAEPRLQLKRLKVRPMTGKRNIGT